MSWTIHLTAPSLDALKADAAEAAASLERGKVLSLEALRFPLLEGEQAFISSGLKGIAAKNISFTPGSDAVKGAELTVPDQAVLTHLLTRFGDFAEALVLAIAPGYRTGLKRGRASFRPAEIQGRETSWRKDDRRRHVDAFPSTPTQGKRLLRVFANADQSGVARCWRIGPDFSDYAQALLPQATGASIPGAGRFMALTGITKSRRTLYDQTMLRLHDAAKRDLNWQRSAPAEELAFQPGQIWMVYTDQLPHAALSGRNALEQTFYVAPEVLAEPALSPLAVLTRMTGREMTGLLP